MEKSNGCLYFKRKAEEESLGFGGERKGYKQQAQDLSGGLPPLKR